MKAEEEIIEEPKSYKEQEIKQLKDALKLEQQLSEKAIVKYRQALRFIMQNSTDEIIIKRCRETLGEN